MNCRNPKIALSNRFAEESFGICLGQAWKRGTLHEKDGQDPSVQVSCGVAFGESGINAETIFKRADTCLYEVKDGAKEMISICKTEKKKKKQ